MADVDDAKRVFEEAGLAFPTLPDGLAAKLKKRGDWLFSTRAIKTSPYELDDYVAETPGRDYAVLAHSGHGIASYAIQYYLAHGALRMFLHLAWGGAYMDEAAPTRIRECFSLADQIVAALPSTVRLRPDDRLTIVCSNFYGSYWKVSEHVQETTGESKPSDVLSEVLLWLTRPIDGGGGRCRRGLGRKGSTTRADGMNVEVPFGFHKGYERWTLPRSGDIDVRVLGAEFVRWDGPLPESTWNRKPVVGSPERPFAELVVAHELAQAGWVSAWVTSGQYLSALEPKRRSIFPAEALELIAEIRAASPEKGGCWDVYAWRAGVPLFAELKWPRDRVRPSQRIWMDSAIQLGVPSDCFNLVECAWRHPTSS